MSTPKDIADDYYIKRLNNAEIFEKHKLKRTKPIISQERVYEHLPIYKHKALRCFHCDVEMESKYVSKTADLIADVSCVVGDLSNKGLQTKELVRVEAVHKKRGYRWSKPGTNYMVNGGHRVSMPICSLCGHKLEDNCVCDSCVKLKSIRALKASALVLNELTSFESIDLDELSFNALLKLLNQFSDFIDDSIKYDYRSAFKFMNFDQKVNLMFLGFATPIADSVLPAIKMVTLSEYTVDFDNIEFRIQNIDELTESLTKLKLLAMNQVRDDLRVINVLEVWETFTLKEATGVLEHYCDIHDIHCTPGENTVAAIKRSLKRYGLAQTARYIYHAVWNARKYSSENNFNRFRAFTFIYGSLNFWIEDPRARTYNAPAFTRKEDTLSEPEDVAIFSRFFLEQNDINYFTDPVSIASLNKVRGGGSTQ